MFDDDSDNKFQRVEDQAVRDEFAAIFRSEDEVYEPTPEDLEEMAQVFAEINLNTPLQDEPEIDL